MLEGQENNKVLESTSNDSNEVSTVSKTEPSDSALVFSTISKTKNSSMPDQPKKKEESEEPLEQNVDSESNEDPSVTNNEEDQSSENNSEVPDKAKKNKTNADLEKENELLKKRLEKARESIGKYSRQKNEWQDRYKALEAKYQKIESTEAPERDDYASDAAYERAMAKFDNLKEQAIERVKTEYNKLMTEHTETFKERIDTQVKEPQKFHATLQKYGKVIASNEPIVWKTFNESPVGPMVMEFFIQKIFADRNQVKLWNTYTNTEKQEHVQNIERGILHHVRGVGQVQPSSNNPSKSNPSTQSKAPKTLTPEFKESKSKNTGLSDTDLVFSTIRKK